MGNPEVSSPLQFLDSLGTSTCDGVGEREPMMKEVYRANSCIYIFFCIHT